jgi:hypothetical protein
MEALFKTSVWHQFGAAIDMLDGALNACPDELWRVRLWDNSTEQPGYAEFWYIAYHTLFWLDLYLSGSVEGFAPPAPFTLSELDPVGFPERPYTRTELQTYLAYCRQKCQATIAALTPERTQQLCKFGWGEVSFAELLMYNMRHVQEHGAQLSLILGQQRDLAAGWVAQAKRR